MSHSLPTDRKALRIDSRTLISYYIGGDRKGKPVVLLHGGGTDHALLSWRETIPALIGAGYYVLAPDHPGYGHSPLPDYPVTMDNLTTYFARFIEQLGLERPSLVGVSMGGAVAISYALRASQNVSRLVLVGSYGFQDTSPWHTLSYFLVRTPGLTAASNRWIQTNRWLLKQTVKQIVRNPKSLTPELLNEVKEALNNRASQKAFGQFQKDEIQRRHNRTNFTEQLVELEIPTLIVHGDKDIGVPLAAARRAASMLPNARLVTFEDAGHWTQRDYPDRFNALLLEFLDQPVAILSDR